MNCNCLEEDVAKYFRVDADGRLWRIFRNPRKGTVPKPADGGLTALGYRIVAVTIGGKRRAILAHRIVAFKTYGTIGPVNEVNHINGIKSDNRPCNLEIVTPSQNVRHSYLLGRDPKKGKAKGMRSGTSKLTDDDVRKIRARRSAGESQTAIAKSYGVSQVAIHKIIAGKAWAHVA